MLSQWLNSLLISLLLIIYLFICQFELSKQAKLAKSVTSQVAHGPALIRLVLGGLESLTPHGWNTNLSQVNSQQMMVLIYLPRIEKEGKLSQLRRLKIRSHNCSNLGRTGDRTGDPVIRRQRSYQLCQPCAPLLRKQTATKLNRIYHRVSKILEVLEVGQNAFVKLFL